MPNTNDVAVAAPETAATNAINTSSMTFKDFGLNKLLIESLESMNFTTPTKIQEATISLSMQGKDILASAETGSGKTAAFVLPMINALLNSPRGGAMVLLPTRELAVQVIDVVHKLLGNKSGIRTALIIGGEPMPKQLNQLRNRPRIIVGTPGRINDHLKRGTMMLGSTDFLVLDETDRMLDMGFGIQLDEIAKYLPEKRQTLMFSATIPQGIVKVSQKYLNNPERVTVGSNNAPVKNIKQDSVFTSQADKYTELKKQLEARTGSVIIFVKTKFGADKLAQRLDKEGQTAEAIHGDLKQRQRDRVISGFRKSKYRVLVATDIAARGLDIPHIEHVINYDLPQCPEDYIHRIGRTARAGKEGSALCLISPDDRGKWRAIQKLIDPSAVSNDSEPSSENRKPRRFGSKPFRFGKARKPTDKRAA
jgi:ATP-dependent RNA helicase DeaD